MLNIADSGFEKKKLTNQNLADSDIINIESIGGVFCPRSQHTHTC